MIDFSQKKYIVISAIPCINILLWAFILCILIKSDRIKSKVLSIVLGSAALAVVTFMLPQMILDALSVASQIREVIDFINVNVLLMFTLNLYLMRVAKNN